MATRFRLAVTVLSLFWTLPIVPASGFGSGNPGAGGDAEPAVVEAIERLGGHVTRDDRQPGKPVVAVDFRYSQVTDAGLKQLKELKSLQALDLYGTQVTDAGLKELKDLEKLQTLDLSGTLVTDAGVTELQAARPGLRILRKETRPEEIEALRKLKELINLEESRELSEPQKQIRIPSETIPPSPKDDRWPGRLELIHLMIKYPVVTLVGIVGGSVLAALLLLLHKKVKWLSKEITWPRMLKVDKPVPQDYSCSLGGMAANYVRKKVITALLFVVVAAGGVCLFGLLDPPGFSEPYQFAFQVLCGVGLLVSILIGAVFYLWAADKFGLK